MTTPRPLLLATAALLALALAPPTRADVAGKTFTFGTHPARTNVTFVSEADLETIHGHTNALEGQVEVAADGRSARGTLRVPVAKLDTGIELRNEHLRGDTWMDAARHPEIVLQLEKVTPIEGGRDWAWTGKLTIKGETRALEGKASVRYVPAQVAEQARLGPGEWVRVKTSFSVRLSDFGITIPDGIGPKVSEVWEVGIDLYGTTQPPRAR